MYDLIKVAFGEDSMSHTQVFEWFCHFKEEQTSRAVNDMSRSSEVIDKLHALLKRNRRLMIREMSEEAGISISSSHAIVTKDLGMN
jgi:hypothetical protein